MKKLRIIAPAILSLLTIAIAPKAHAVPEINPIPEGFEVTTGSCYVHFNPSGGLIYVAEKCNDRQVNEAKKAAQSYVKEQSGSGSEHPSNTQTRKGKTPENLYGTTPPALEDLVDARAGQAENTLISRGYTYKNTVTFDGGKSAYYVENKTGYCVEVGTVEGRYSSIVYNSSDRCQK